MLTSNRDDAEDLTQETTLKALDSEDKYIDNLNFKGWLFTIMRNLFINHYRKSVRAGVVIDRSEDLYQLNSKQDSGLMTPEGSVSATEIEALIAELDDSYRIPFSMMLAGYKYAEISKTVGVPVGTIKSRIFLARKRLQSQLKGYRD